MTEPYPGIRYSKESAAFIIAVAALRRAGGEPLDQAIESGISAFWTYSTQHPSGSLDLDGLRRYISSVAG